MPSPEFGPREESEAVKELNKKELSQEELELILSLGWLTFAASNSEKDQVEIYEEFMGGKTELYNVSFNSDFIKNGFKRQYCVNNSVIAFYDKFDRYNVAPWTPKREEALKGLGFTKEGAFIYVLFSSGSIPGDLTLRKQWEDMRAAAREEWEEEKTAAA